MPVVEPEFAWKCEPKAEELIKRHLQLALHENLFLQQLQQELHTLTSTRLFDWVDHIQIGHSDTIAQELMSAGFTEERQADIRRFHHKGAQLPNIAMKSSKDEVITVAVQVDSIADFLMVRGLSVPIEGSPLSGYRLAVMSKEKNTCVLVVERRGSNTFLPVSLRPDEFVAVQVAYEKWKTRPRAAITTEDELACIERSIQLAEKIVASAGIGMAAHIVLDVERQFWQAKNRAGQIQKNRQDRAGMGWANHDHHTFRCARSHFHRIIHCFEVLGFTCRERFYAGKEAGWGAQVMEHPIGRYVLFLDVDLTENEVAIDFAHQPLPPLEKLGTIGLWCALHGQSLADAGMHHLEAQFDFSLLESALTGQGVAMMPPFSDFSYLKQAFTVGEMWPVAPQRVQILLQEKLITKEQAGHFLKDGALGSHLENLQRNEGFKGFNQKNVSSIIKETDPRRLAIGMS